jgi:hypothetical protein
MPNGGHAVTTISGVSGAGLGFTNENFTFGHNFHFLRSVLKAIGIFIFSSAFA